MWCNRMECDGMLCGCDGCGCVMVIWNVQPIGFQCAVQLGYKSYRRATAQCRPWFQRNLKQRTKKEWQQENVLCCVYLLCCVGGMRAGGNEPFFVHTRFIIYSPENFSCIGFLLQTKAWGGVVGQGAGWGVVWCSIGGVYGWVYEDFSDSFCGGNRFLQHNYTTVLFRVCCCGFAW